MGEHETHTAIINLSVYSQQQQKKRKIKNTLTMAFCKGELLNSLNKVVRGRTHDTCNFHFTKQLLMQYNNIHSGFI